MVCWGTRPGRFYLYSAKGSSHCQHSYLLFSPTSDVYVWTRVMLTVRVRRNWKDMKDMSPVLFQWEFWDHREHMPQHINLHVSLTTLR